MDFLFPTLKAIAHQFISKCLEGSHGYFVTIQPPESVKIHRKRGKGEA